MNQFRRDPITGQWSIIIHNETDIRELISNKHSRKSVAENKEPSQCQFCAGFEAQIPPEIFAVRPGKSKKNEEGWTVRVIPNKQPYLQIYGELNNRGVGLYDVLDGIGAHELVIESPNHNVQIWELESPQIEDVLLAYKERISDLKKDNRFRYILLHKNYGEGSKRLVHHSYSHIIATPITPTRVKMELMNAMEHYQYKERCLFCDIIHQELSSDERVIFQNEEYLAVIPFASRSPFEVWIMPKQHETFFEAKTNYSQLASILKSILTKVKTVLNDPNFVMVLHTGPNITTGRLRGYWKTVERDFHWHIEITPRFRGFASFDIGSGFNINVVSPETATRILKQERIE
ncbi:galactose-1-phosphate uridylyltransferase [bacterium]|nr:galactose-1-phosphate uridylyltransferase [bacterium]